MMTTDTKPNYASLKQKEAELLVQLARVKDEIKIAENEIVKDKLNTAIQCLIDVDDMTSGYYRCSIETYCEECEAPIETDIDLSEIISVLNQLR